MANPPNRVVFAEFSHTGDIGIELRAPTREELFANAAVAMATLMVDIDEVRNSERREVQIEGAAGDVDAIHDLLTAFLNLFFTQNFIWREVKVKIENGNIKTVANGETFAPSRHPFHTELKAVTYHQLEINHDDSGWQARIIFDV